MKLQRLDGVALAVFAGQVALAAYVFWHGKTGPLPLHFNFHGEPNRWGDRAQVAQWLMVIAALNAGLYGLLPALSGRARAGAGGINQARILLLTACGLISAFLAATGAGIASAGGAQRGRLLMSFLAVLMVAFGALIGKVAPNPILGVRTFWALRSRLSWDRSNRLLGRLWFWLGLVALVLVPFSSQPAGVMATTGAMILAVLAAAVESWRIWRSDPDRRTAYEESPKVL